MELLKTTHNFVLGGACCLLSPQWHHLAHKDGNTTGSGDGLDLFRTPITIKLKADFACFGYVLWGVVLPRSTYPPTKLDGFELLAVFSVCFTVLL